MRILRLFAAAMAVGIGVESAGAQRAFTSGDFLKLRTPASVALSPDGERVAYVVDDRDVQRDQLRSTIQIVSASGGPSRRLTEGRAPAWSRDGRRLAFLGPTAADTRLWLIAADGGPPTPLTRDGATVGAISWSPDSRQLAAIISAPDSTNARQPTRLTIIDAGSGATRVLATGDVEPADVAWSPLGNEIAFSAAGDLYVVSIDGGAPRVVVQRDGLDVQPQWSPDGSRIAFASGQGKRRSMVRLSVVSATGCPDGGCVPTDLGQDFDGWIAGYPPKFFTWSADGSTLYVSGLRRMTHLLYAIPVVGGPVRPLMSSAQAYWSFSVSHDGRTVAFLASDSASAGDVVISRVERFAPRRLTTLNPQLAAFGLRAPETVRWTSRDGLDVEGLLLKPAGYREGHRYPLLVQMEGTYGAYDVSFSGRVAADNNAAFPYQQQVFASAGYAVLMPNPRGSWGYGEQFAMRGRGDFGTGPLADILTGIDELIRRGIADSSRVGIMGTGYDAYRALFALTQSDRFRAASVDGPLYDLVDLYKQLGPGATLMDALIGGSPSSLPDEYARISPANFADRLRTPLLISYSSLTSGPAALQASQGRVLEGVLRRNGVPVDVVVYDATPGLQTWGPRALATLVTRNVDWFHRWIPPT